MERYRKLRELGAGTHGIVYLAQVLSTPPREFSLARAQDDSGGEGMPAEVALKKIRMGTAQGLGQEAIRELRLLLEMRHEHIVRVFDVFVKNRNLHLAMERMHIDLEALIRCPALVLNSPLVAALLQPILLASTFFP
jgi:serine/threonine protein kinase